MTAFALGDAIEWHAMGAPGLQRGRVVAIVGPKSSIADVLRGLGLTHDPRKVFAQDTACATRYLVDCGGVYRAPRKSTIDAMGPWGGKRVRR